MSMEGMGPDLIGFRKMKTVTFITFHSRMVSMIISILIVS